MGWLSALVKGLASALLGAGLEIWREKRRDANLVKLGHNAGEIAKLRTEREVYRRAMAIEDATPADLTGALRDL